MANESENKEESVEIKKIEVDIMELLTNGIVVETGKENHLILDLGRFTFSE